MKTVKDEEGNDKIVWDEVKWVKWESGPIVGPYNYPIQSNGRLSVDPMTGNVSLGMRVDQNTVFSNTTEWARIDKDLKLVHLDMDLCAKGSANVYTALAIGVWNAALEEAAKYAAGECGGAIEDAIRELKK